jgi:hypothetical protein
MNARAAALLSLPVMVALLALAACHPSNQSPPPGSSNSAASAPDMPSSGASDANK